MMNERLSTEAGNRLDDANKAAGVDPNAVNLAAEIQLDDGTKVTVDELKAGYMRQSDYTKKTQTVAEERKAIEAERAVHEQNAAFAETMRDVFTRDESLYNRVTEIVEGRSPSPAEKEPPKKDNGGDPPQEKEQAPQQPVTVRNYEYDQRLKDVESKLRQADVDRAAARLQTEFKVPEEDLKDVISTAVQNFVPGVGYYENMLRAYKVVQFDKIQEGKHEQDRKMQEKRDAFMMGGTGPSAAGRQLSDGEAIVQSVIDLKPKEIL